MIQIFAFYILLCTLAPLLPPLANPSEAVAVVSRVHHFSQRVPSAHACGCPRAFAAAPPAPEVRQGTLRNLPWHLQ